MKKLLVLMLVLGMASLANATVIAVDFNGVGSLGNTGASTDPLEIGETIEIKLVLNHNPYSGWPSYDGYALSSMDLSLDVIGNASLDAGTKNKSGDPIWQYNTALSPFAVTDPNTATNPPYAEIADGLDSISGVGLTPLKGVSGGLDLMWDLIITCTGDGMVTIDLSNYIAGDYAPFTDAAGTSPWPASPGWIQLTDGDLGNLLIHQVPEPATIALLGLGGLCLLRRRR